ncbi:MAG: hypothetical protein NTY90_05260 [Candidatus Micrarchaeota archaeon]|nr:hypothetical protein [Candidatus Micrarchaeota archaeon]
MNKNFVLAAVLLASLFAFGCVSSAPQQSASPTGGATATPTPTATLEAATATPAPAGAAVTGKDYSELLAMGKSLSCDLTVTTDEGKLTGKAYFKGGDARIETMGKVAMTEVFKGGKVYTNVPAGMDQMLGGQTCDWLRFDPEKMKEQTQTVSSKPVETSTLDDKTKVVFDCREAVVGDDKFAVQNDCDMTEIINKIMGGLTVGTPTAPLEGTPTRTPTTAPSGSPTPTGPIVDAATCAPFVQVPSCSYVPASDQALCGQCKSAGFG